MGLAPGITTINGIDYELRERIINYGQEGSGKTQNWLTIANLVPPGVKVYVADSDQGVLRSMSKDFGHLSNVEITPIMQFLDYLKWAKELRDKVKHDDWVVVDMASTAYTHAQNYYFQRKYDMSREELELERMLEGKKGALIESEDWTLIRNLFLNWWERFVVIELSTVLGAHLFATSEAKSVFEHFDGKAKDKSTYLDYKDIGFRPEAHRSFPHKVHTVLYSSRSSTGFWITPTKDRQRDMGNMKVDNFALDYLVGRAGWTLDG